MNKKPAYQTADPDLISRYRADELQEAEATYQAILDECAARVMQARQVFGELKMGIINDRMRLRRGCSVYDQPFAELVIPRLLLGEYSKIEIEEATPCNSERLF